MKDNEISQCSFVAGFSAPCQLTCTKAFIFSTVFRQGHSEFIGINCISLKLSFRVLSSAGG